MGPSKIYSIFMTLLISSLKFPDTAGQTLQIYTPERGKPQFQIKRQVPNQYILYRNQSQNQPPDLSRVYFANIPIDRAIAQMKGQAPNRYFIYPNLTHNQAPDQKRVFVKKIPIDSVIAKMMGQAPNRYFFYTNQTRNQLPDRKEGSFGNPPTDGAAAQMKRQIPNPYFFYPNETQNQLTDLSREYFMSLPLDGAVPQDFLLAQPQTTPQPPALEDQKISPQRSGKIKDAVTDNRSTIFNVLILSNYLSLSPFKDDLEGPGPEGRAVSKFDGASEDEQFVAGEPSVPMLIPKIRNSTIMFLNDGRLPSYTANVTDGNQELSRKRFSFDDINLDMRNLRDLVSFRRKPVPLEPYKSVAPQDADDPSKAKTTADLTGSQDGPEMDLGPYREITHFHGDNSSLIMIRLNKKDDGRPWFSSNLNRMQDRSEEKGRGMPFPIWDPRKFRKSSPYGSLGWRGTARGDEGRNISEDFREMEMHLAMISDLMARIERKKKLAANVRPVVQALDQSRQADDWVDR